MRLAHVMPCALPFEYLRNKRVHQRQAPAGENVRHMVTRIQCLLCTLLICFGASRAMGQTSLAEFQKLLQDKGTFSESDFAAIERSRSVVRLAPVSDKREVA